MRGTTPELREVPFPGIPLVINPDAHATEELGFVRYGVDVARRGWLEKGDVFNTKTLPQVAKALEQRRK